MSFQTQPPVRTVRVKNHFVCFFHSMTFWLFDEFYGRENYFRNQKWNNFDAIIHFLLKSSQSVQVEVEAQIKFSQHQIHQKAYQINWNEIKERIKSQNSEGIILQLPIDHRLELTTPSSCKWYKLKLPHHSQRLLIL